MSPTQLSPPERIGFIGLGQMGAPMIRNFAPSPARASWSRWRFNSGFSLGLMVKDLRTALEVAHATGTPAPLGEACVEAWARAEQLLGGQADHTAVVKYWERLAGSEIKGG